jgi:hypothetical protein
MVDQLVLDFTASNTGRILYIPPSTYMATVGWLYCDAGRADSSNMDWGAFFSFDTSALPDHAQIDDVHFRIRRRNDPAGEPQYYSIEFWIGSFIGATLDGNAGEWTGGSLMVTLGVKPADKTTLDLSDDGQDPCPHIDKTGTTDIKILDASTKGTGDDVWSTNFNKDGDFGCKLYVTYSVPSATATGVGTASCSAEIVADASGTVTGIGDVEASAAVTVDASGSATGVGEATSVGTAVRDGASTVVGTGGALGSAYIIRGGAGTATGVGSATGSAAIVASAAASATGVGTASLEGWIVYAPLALHEATISVAPTHSSSASTGAVHTATTSCDVADTATRGPRRAN